MNRFRARFVIGSFSLLGLSLGLATSVHAQTYTPLVLPVDDLNQDIRTFSGGFIYDPLFVDGSATLGGVPFDFETNSDTGNTAFEVGTLDIPVDIFGVTTVDTLINTAFGSLGNDGGSLTFDGSLGDVFTVQLVEGDNVRDHFLDGFVNTTSDPTTTEYVYGNSDNGTAHLDMQTIALPSVFASETLDDIVFNDFGDGGDGQPFIVAATAVSGVPDQGGGSILIGLAALGGFGYLLRRKAIASAA